MLNKNTNTTTPSTTTNTTNTNTSPNQNLGPNLTNNGTANGTTIFTAETSSAAEDTGGGFEWGKARSIDSTNSQYQTQEVGRFTRVPESIPASASSWTTMTKVSDSQLQVGDILFDSIAVMLTCSRHNMMALAPVPGPAKQAALWFPVSALKARFSYAEAVDTYLAQILSAAKCTTPYRRPVAIEHLRLQVPQAFCFVNRVLFHSELLGDPSSQESGSVSPGASTTSSDRTICCTAPTWTGGPIQWISFQAILGGGGSGGSTETKLWGDEPQFYLQQWLDRMTLGIPTGPFQIDRVSAAAAAAAAAAQSPLLAQPSPPPSSSQQLSAAIEFEYREWSITALLRLLAENGSPREQMLRACAIAERDLIWLYGEFAQHCFPSSGMNWFAFRAYMCRTGLLESVRTGASPANATASEAYFRAFVTSTTSGCGGGKRSTQIDAIDFILGLAAMDKRAPHGGSVGLLRVQYIFRFYNNGEANADALSPASVRAFTHDLLLIRANGAVPSDEAVIREMIAVYASFGVEPGTPVPCKQFAKRIGNLQVRGTSSMFRARQAPVPLLRSKAAYGDIHRCTIRSERMLCVRCREKRYSLALHHVTLGRAGTIVEPMPVPMARAIAAAEWQRIGGGGGGAGARVARRRSDRYFQGGDICNELLDGIRKSFECPTSAPWFLAAAAIEKVLAICDEAKALFKAEPRVVPLTSPAYVLGDIHGNLHDLLIYEQQLWRTGPSCLTCNYLFLGDYVDRGAYSVECALYLFSCKILAPDRIVMLRGNHETRAVQQHFTFHRECLEKFRAKGAMIWERFNDVFDHMPLAAIIDEQIYAAHGGIPTSVSTVRQLAESIPIPLVEPETECAPAWEVLWNDPVSGPEYAEIRLTTGPANLPIGFVPNLKRGTAYYFADDAVNAFLLQNNLSHIIRAHEVQPAGYSLMFNGRVITVFSCSQYCGMANEAAVLLLDGNKIRIIKVDTNLA